MMFSMDARATVRVRSGTVAGRPLVGNVETAAKLLKELGFGIVRIGRFGISIEGTPETFQSALGVEVRSGKPLVAPVHPKSTELANLLDLIEVTPDPIHFDDRGRGRVASA